MDHDNSVNQENLDDDILQCRADILKSRKRSKPATDTKPIATEADADKKTVRIPPFQELVNQKPVVDGQWEQPLQIKPEKELDPANIVTAEEEAALFPVTEDPAPEQEPEATPEDGLDALRKVVELANSQANSAIEELEEIEGIEDMMASESIEALDDVKAEMATEVDHIDAPDEIQTVEELAAIDEQTEVTAAIAAIMETTELQIEPVKDTDNVETTSDTEDSAGEMPVIPKFNLAEKILTEQRQVASQRRQRPAASRNLNVMPIAGTVGKIIEEAKKAVVRSTEKNASIPETPAKPEVKEIAEKKPLALDRIEVEKIEEVHQEPSLSIAACMIVNDSDRLNPFQEDIITDIVSRDIAQFCGEIENL